MRIVTAAEMREIDRRTTEEFGIPSLTLMENAGSAVAEFCLRECREAKTIGVVCGKGNNGGDGLVAARKLHESGKEVRVLLLADRAEVKGDAAEMLKRLPVKPVHARKVEELNSEAVAHVYQADLLMDAILGTGFKPPLSALYAAAIGAFEDNRAMVVSVDVPSGADCDRDALSGGPSTHTVVPDAVVTFTAPKLLLATAAMPVAIANIGSPDELTRRIGTSLNAEVAVAAPLSQSRDFAMTHEAVQLPARPPDSNKGDYGHVLLVGGSVGKAGSVAMAAMAALRSGTGLATVACPASVLPTVAGFAPEVMTLPLAETEHGTVSVNAGHYAQMDELLRGKTVLAVGPGISRHPESADFARTLIARSTIPTVIDADGLNAFEGHASLLDGSKRLLVLTPHPGEMARLTGLSVADVQKDRMGIARSFAQKHASVVVLKGHRTVIAAPDGRIWLNTTGNAGMAKGGTGDVLTGMIAALLAQAPELVQHGQVRLAAIVTAVYLHGLAGDLAAKQSGTRSMLATDLIANISHAIELLNALRREPWVWLGRSDIREAQAG